MDFMTLIFLLFLVVTAISCYFLPKIVRPVLLLAASYAFYLYTPSNREYVWLLIGLTIINWLLGFCICAARNHPALRGIFLALSLLCSFSALFYFKYFNLFFSPVLGFTLNIVQPLGLSYYIFQSSSYAIELYKGKIDVERNPIHFALFVSFFPCIVTGPIERADHLLKQLHNPVKFNYDRCAGNAFRILWGYFKKLVLADNLAVFVAAVYSMPSQMNGPVLLAATLLFPIQLYMDFSGCCDIAIGAAGILGFELLENFNNPFLAKTFSDLWRRWHMSLTGWFREYVYFPLGGSRKGFVRNCLNLLIVFALSGLWHGAAWGYLIWGICCGAIQVIALTNKQFLSPHIPVKLPSNLITDWARRLITYLLFSFSVIFFSCGLFAFRFQDVFCGIPNNWGVYHSFSEILDELAGLGLGNTLGIVIFLGCVIVFFVESAGRVSDWIRRQSWTLRWPLYYGLSVAILFFGAFGQSIFIYQRY